MSKSGYTVEKKYNITAVQSEYEKDGETRKHRQTVGNLLLLKAKNGSTFMKMNMYNSPKVEYDLFEVTD